MSCRFVSVGRDRRVVGAVERERRCAGQRRRHARARPGRHVEAHLGAVLVDDTQVRGRRVRDRDRRTVAELDRARGIHDERPVADQRVGPEVRERDALRHRAGGPVLTDMQHAVAIPRVAARPGLDAR